MMLLAVGDVVWLGVVGLVQAVVLAVIAFVAERARQEAAATAATAAAASLAAAKEVKDVKTLAGAAAGKVEEVKQALEQTTTATDKKLDGLAKVADATHILVNNQHQLALQSVAELARWKAVQTKHPEDEAAADKAEQALQTHQGKQARVDAT